MSVEHCAGASSSKRRRTESNLMMDADGDSLPGDSHGGHNRLSEEEAPEQSHQAACVWPRWRLPAGRAIHAGNGKETEWRCEQLLEQAFSCSNVCDVKFVLDSGDAQLSGHWSMLSVASRKFKEMAESQGDGLHHKRELHAGGVSVESLRGLLEWMYLGHAGQHMENADGREVWQFANYCELNGIKEWLMGDGLDMHAICGAAQYAVEGGSGGVDDGRDDLLKACQAKAMSVLSGVNEQDVQGLSVEAARLILCAGEQKIGSCTPERAVEMFRFVQKWAKANRVSGGQVGDDVDVLLGAFELSLAPHDFIRTVVKESGLLSVARVWDILAGGGGVPVNNGAGKVKSEERQGAVGAAKWDEVKSFGKAEKFQQCEECIAVHGSGDEQRLAVADYTKKRVLVFNVRTKQLIKEISGKTKSAAKFDYPGGLGFNRHGHLVVCDFELNKVIVFGKNGEFKQSFGSPGSQNGQFNGASCVAFTSQGEMAICDEGNHRVQVFREDGQFAFTFGRKGKKPGCFNVPSGIAVTADNNFVVCDVKNSRLQIFTMLGSLVKSITSAQFLKEPMYVAVNVSGQLLVSCGVHKAGIQVFSKDGEYVNTIAGRADDPLGALFVKCIAVDGDGRLFIGDVSKEDDHLVRLLAPI